MFSVPQARGLSWKARASGACHPKASLRRVAASQSAAISARSRARGRRLALSVLDTFVLIPVGSGDSSHLDAQVDLPSPVTLGEGKVVIGREASTNVNLVLKIPTVSSTHAMIDFIDGEFFLTDLSSTNGTFVNGEELPAGKPVKLTAGDEVIFGDEFLAKFVLEEVQP